MLSAMRYAACINKLSNKTEVKAIAVQWLKAVKSGLGLSPTTSTDMIRFLWGVEIYPDVVESEFRATLVRLGRIGGVENRWLEA